MDELLKKNRLKSCDDDPKDFNCKSFERAMAQMECADTNIGGILASMVYQIEADNGNAKGGAQPAGNVNGFEELSSMRGISDLNVIGSPENQSGLAEADNNKDKLTAQLDDMFSALAIEQGVVQTDYSHQFREDKVLKTM